MTVFKFKSVFTWQTVDFGRRSFRLLLWSIKSDVKLLLLHFSATLLVCHSRDKECLGGKRTTLVLSSQSLCVRISHCILKTVAWGTPTLTEEGLGMMCNPGETQLEPASDKFSTIRKGKTVLTNETLLLRKLPFR